MVAWSRVMAKFLSAASTLHFHFSTNHFAAIKVLNFPQPPHFTFTFHTSSCCHHPALLPDHGVHHGISSPPRPALLGESTLCWYFPPNPSPLQFTLTWGTCGCLSWWAEASLGAASHGDFFHCHAEVDFTFLCPN